jgi:hypothetical protein
MSIITQRAFTRSDNRAPVDFSSHSEREFHEGEIINGGVGGMALPAGFVETCQLCDKIIHHREEEGVNLCENCRSHVNSFSASIIENYIEKYLIGNVL